MAAVIYQKLGQISGHDDDCVNVPVQVGYGPIAWTGKDRGTMGERVQQDVYRLFGIL